MFAIYALIGAVAGLVAGYFIRKVQIAGKVSCSRLDFRERHFGVLRFGTPFGRTVVRVHVIRVVLSQGEHEPDIPFRECIHIASAAAWTRAQPHICRAGDGGNENEREDDATGDQ